MKRFPATAAPDTSPAESLRRVLDLHEFGENLMRGNLRRDHPGASPEEIERSLVAWLRSRPGAEAGDSAGRPCRRAAFETLLADVGRRG